MGIVSSKPTITRKELEGVLNCLIKDELLYGVTVKNFETRLSDFLGIKYCCAVNSQTAAYHLAFKALEIGEGDEVIIPSYFNYAPLSALTFTGGTPVLVDIDSGSLTPSAGQILEKITEKTRAVVAGHLFGFITELPDLGEQKVSIIEDISYSIGADIHGDTEKKAAITIASFSPTMMITTGNGAVVMTPNSRHFAVMRDLRGNNEMDATLKYDYTMTDFQAAMGVSQLMRLPNLIKRRREIARMYYDALKLTSHKSLYAFNDAFLYQSFPVLFDATAEHIEKYWKKAGIELYRPIQFPLHHYCDGKPMDFPNSDRLTKKMYSLPIYPALSKKEIEKISRALANFI